MGGSWGATLAACMASGIWASRSAPRTPAVGIGVAAVGGSVSNVASCPSTFITASVVATCSTAVLIDRPPEATARELGTCTMLCGNCPAASPESVRAAWPTCSE